MDLSRTQLTGLMNNVSHEKTKFIQLMHKLKAILALNKDHKLILTSLDKLILTSSPLLIYENINFSHPILKILTEVMEKTRKMGEGEVLFVEILKKLIEKVTYLLDNGIKAKNISDILKDLKSELKNELYSESKANESKANEMKSDILSVEDSVSKLNISEKNDTNFENNGNLLSESLKAYINQNLGDKSISDLLIKSIENTKSFDTENVRINKVATGSTEDSYRLEGMLMNRAPEGTIKTLSNTSVGIFNCAFDINRTELKGTVLMHTAAELLNFTNDEVTSAKALVDSLNVNVVIVCGNVNDLFVDFANSRNILVLRIFSKFDLKRLSVLLNSEISTVLGPIRKPGFVKLITTIQDGNSFFTKIIGNGNVNTIVIKNTMIQKCEELERKVTAVLETLKKNQKRIPSLEFAKSDFFIESAKLIGNSTVIHTTIAEGLKEVKFENLMILEDQVRCVKYSFDFLATMLEVDDYLVAKTNALDIKPRDNPHWDDD